MVTTVRPGARIEAEPEDVGLSSARLGNVTRLVQGYVDAGHKMVDDEHFAEWEAGVKGLYDSMVEIRITPTWAKILDFETRIPSAVEELVRQKQSAG